MERESDARKPNANRRSVVSLLTLVGVAGVVGTQNEIHAMTKKTKVFGRTVEEIWDDPMAAQMVNAASAGEAHKTEVFVKNGVNVDALGRNDWTPLAWVTVLGNLDGMRKLLELGANPNRRVIGEKTGTSNPLVMAISQKLHCDRLALLLKHGLEPNSRWASPPTSQLKVDGYSLLMESVMSKPCVELLVKHGADVNLTMEIGNRTALEVAANLGQLDVMEYLLTQGANVELDRAAKSLQNGLMSDELRRVKLLRMLKERGAKILPSRMYPNTPVELLSI
jgi:ankyrin repeat protein